MSAHSEKKAIFNAAARWFVRHGDGLSELETAEFEQWLAADTRHSAAFERYSRAWGMLRRPMLAGKQDAFAREIQAGARRRRARRARMATAAASAAASVLLVLALLWQRPSGDTGAPPSTIAHSARRAPAAQPRQGFTTITSPERRLLDDGSLVEIKQGAIIDVRYDADARRVVLVSGEAHFQVKKGLSRPFVVVAGGIEVRAVGTAFAVGLGSKRMEVWVTEGQVAVEKPAEDGEDEDQKSEVGSGGEAAGAGASPSPVPCPASPGVASGMMAPATVASGQKPEMPAPASAPPAASGGPVLVATLGMNECIVVETAPARTAAPPVVTAVTPAEINKRLAWRVTRLEFSSTPLAEAVALVNSHSRLPGGSTTARLVLDESLSGLVDEPVSGYSHANDIETFVRMLNVIAGIESERRGDEIVLFKRRK